MYRILSVSLVTSLLLHATACSSTKSKLQPVEINRTPAPGKAGTLTLVLKAEWNADSSVRFSIYNDIRNEGLRPGMGKARKSSGFLLCFTGSAPVPADSVYIDHPLRAWAETSIGQGKTIRELFIREEAYMEVSVPYRSEMNKLRCIDLQTQKQQILDIR